MPVLAPPGDEHPAGNEHPAAAALAAPPEEAPEVATLPSGGCSGGEVELIEGPTWRDARAFEIETGSVTSSHGGCAGALLSFTARASDGQTLSLSLAPSATDTALTCGRSAALSIPGLTATRAELYSAGTMRRAGVSCRTFIGAADFEDSAHALAAQARFRVVVPSATVAALEERYEAARATLFAIVTRSGSSCSYDVLTPLPDGEYRASFDEGCDLDLVESGWEGDMSPVRSALSSELYPGARTRGHILRDITRASASLVASATDEESECSVILGFGVPFLTQPDEVVPELPPPTTVVRFARCDGPLSPLHRAITAAAPFDPSE